MLAIVTCHYNFAGYDRPRQNLWRFLRQMKRDGVPVYGVEIYIGGHNPITVGVENWIQVEVNCNQIMWQKEAALNIAEKMVPVTYSNIAWIDSDVWFDRPDWVEVTEEALARHEVVQMFTRTNLIDRDGSILVCKKSAVYGITEKWDVHTGFAWAMRRDIWCRGGGLFQFSVAGSADSLMCFTFLGVKPFDSVFRQLGAKRDRYIEWAKNYSSISLGAVPMICYHEWHGDRENRRYYERGLVLSSMDSGKHIKIGDNGLLEFTSEADPEHILSMHQYYFDRREDG